MFARPFYMILWVLIGFGSQFSFAQQELPIAEVVAGYEGYREKSLDQRRFSYKDIQPLIEKWKKHPDFQVRKVGTSIEGRDLNLISTGTGEIDVFLWSQMHGDESTATMAIFDILHFLESEGFSAEKEEILSQVKLHFLPMLNPDGAEKFQRRNALGIDVNRDALRLQSPEGKTLKRVRDSLNADFGFNLHDQSRYYNAEGTEKPATISFLAPAYNYEKDVNQVRERAMKLIVAMNRHLQEQIPGMVGRYNDDFEPRAFGDNIQKWGTSTVLIESGGYPDDPEKQHIRKLNFSAILAAISAIANESYEAHDSAEYFSIPENDNKLYDLKLKAIKYNLLGDPYILDLGINFSETSAGKNGKMNYRGRIADQGDLSTNYAYETAELLEFEIAAGKVYPTVLADIKALESLDLKKNFSDGIIFYRIRSLPKNREHYPFPVVLVKETYKPSTHLQPGVTPNFLLQKQGQPLKAVVNGFLYDLKDPDLSQGNGVILR